MQGKNMNIIEVRNSMSPRNFTIQRQIEDQIYGDRSWLNENSDNKIMNREQVSQNDKTERHSSTIPMNVKM